MITPAPQLQSTTLGVRGMHCPNCEVLIERRIKDVPGVVGVAGQPERGQGRDSTRWRPLDIDAS